MASLLKGNSSSKRSLEVVDRESSSSPTKIRQICNSPLTSVKFKQPMTFTPTLKPSPSKEDEWREELGLTETELFMNSSLDEDEDKENDKYSKLSLEIKVLHKELEYKDKERDDLLRNQKRLEEKTNNYKAKISDAEGLHRSNIKILKKTNEMALREKDELIYNLRCFVDEAQMKMKQMLDEKGGEDAEVYFDFSNSLQPLVRQVDQLQSEKVQLLSKCLNLEKDLDELKEKQKSLQNSFKTDFVPINDYKLLQSENNLLKQSNELLQAQAEKANIHSAVTHGEEYVQKYREELRLANERHHEEIVQCQAEIIKYKKKFREIDRKYTTLAYTPPKVQVQKIFDTDMEKKLELLKSEKEKMTLEMIQLQKNVADLSEINDDLRNKKNKHESNIKRYESKITELENELKDVSNLKRQIKQETIQTEKLKAELEEKENEIEIVIKEFEDQEQILKEKMAKQIKDAIISTEEKYSKITTFNKILFNAVVKLSSELLLIKQEKSLISAQLRHMMSFLKAEHHRIKTELISSVHDTNKKSQILALKYKMEIQKRKALHNQLVELKGNIRVMCRVRPVIKEDGNDSHNAMSYDDDDDAVVCVRHKNSLRRFDMDKVFKSDASQEEVFEDVKALVTSCLDGYNICIFAYGQTGSGKTYTMEGTEENPGINQRALCQLFEETKQQLDWEYTILVSFVEIYNEMLRDLLSAEPTTKLDIKQTKDGLSVPGLTHVRVSGVDEVNEVFALGHRNRMTATTVMNERSSRSHSILTVTVFGHNINTNTKINGKLNLVDLAGSERISKSGSEGLRMKEAQNINKSLSALGDVIQALKNKQTHIPYRNTKLTYLLQDSLGGDSKTLMVVQVSPVDKNAGETFCSLDFAQRVRAVELGQATTRRSEK